MYSHVPITKWTFIKPPICFNFNPCYEGTFVRPFCFPLVLNFSYTSNLFMKIIGHALERQHISSCFQRCSFKKYIVYYAPREEKTWTVNSLCKLPPSQRRRWQTRDVGWPILLPWSVYYFSSHRGRKWHIPVFASGGNGVLSARCEEK